MPRLTGRMTATHGLHSRVVTAFTHATRHITHATHALDSWPPKILTPPSAFLLSFPPFLSLSLSAGVCGWGCGCVGVGVGVSVGVGVGVYQMPGTTHKR